jgi:drug/metabolite transporter (DMT)-like permease
LLKTLPGLSLGILAISFAAIFIKFCSDVPAVMIATYRLVLASAVLLVIARGKGVRFSFYRKKQIPFCVLGGLLLALHFSFWISSLKYTSVASSVVLVTTNPIFVGILSYFFFREKPTVELIVGILLSLAGSAILAVGDSGLQGLTIRNASTLIGDVLALLGAVMASGYWIVGYKLREEMDILPYTTMVYSFAALFLLLISLFKGLSFTGYRPSSYLFMALLAVIPQLIGHTLINWALKHLKASLVAISILGEPIGATILAYLFFRETVGTTQLVGMFLIFLAIIVASRKGRRIDDAGRAGLPRPPAGSQS